MTPFEMLIFFIRLILNVRFVREAKHIDIVKQL